MLGLRTLSGFDKNHLLSILTQPKRDEVKRKIDIFLKDKILISTNNIISMNPEKWLLSEYVSRELFILNE